MKKYLLFAIVFALFAGCSQPTTETPETQSGTTPEIKIPATVTPEVTTPETVTPATPIVSETGQSYYVKNSKWENVDLSKIAANLKSKSASRVARAVASREAIDLIDAENIVTEYNTVTNDDQLRLYTEDVPIAESPTVNIYYVNEGDYAPLAQVLNLDRADFVARYADFKQDERVYGGIMFVDKVPPVPVIPPDTRTRHEKYALYIVSDVTNKIVVYNGFRYEIHIDDLWDSLSDEIKAGYRNGIDDLMAWYVQAYQSETTLYGQEPTDIPWRVISGQLYTEPTDPPVTE